MDQEAPRSNRGAGTIFLNIFHICWNRLRGNQLSLTGAVTKIQVPGVTILSLGNSDKLHAESKIFGKIRGDDTAARIDRQPTRSGTGTDQGARGTVKTSK